MLYLILAVLLSVLIILTFRAFANFGIHTTAAVVVNYFICTLQGLLLAEQIPTAQYFLQASWLPLAIATSFLFICTFVLVGLSAQRNGVSVASVSSKLGMIITIIAAVFLYGDSLSWLKVCGIGLALLSVVFVSVKKGGAKTKSTAELFQLPLLIFCLSGAIEVLLNYAQVYYLDGEDFKHFLTCVFAFSALLGSLYLLLRIGKDPGILHWKNLLWGCLLGLPNYLSLYAMFLALETSGLESSVVFPLVNIGVVSLAAIGSVLIFKERLSALNLTGLACALMAIALIGFS